MTPGRADRRRARRPANISFHHASDDGAHFEIIDDPSHHGID
jgi:hypothetical protein